MRRFVFILCITLTAVVITACGDNSGSAITSGAGQFNETDVTFTQSMIPHHEQAVEMASLALDLKAGASVKTKDIATRIKQAQGPEITMMRSMMQAWGASGMSEMAGHDTVGMMSAAEMTALAALTGSQFDRSWTEMMIKHHQGAIEMATTAKKNGKSSQVRTLADQIVATQTAEINELQVLTK